LLKGAARKINKEAKVEDTLREQLGQVEDELRSLREERARASGVSDAALAAYASHESDESLATVKQAKDALQAVGLKLEKTSDRQAELLRKLADRESGVSGFSPSLSGWDQAAQTLSLADGVLRSDTRAASLLTVPASARRTNQPPPPASGKYVYPVFAAAPFGDAGDLAATDFVISFSEAEVTGVEIEPATSTSKAELPVDVSLATPTAKVFAIVVDDVPAKIFETQAALAAFLEQEMRRRLDVSYDAHVVAAIEGASPPSGSTGTGLVAQIRNGIASHRDIGSNPRYLAVTPQDAAALDLTEDTAGHFVFRVDLEGSSNPVWSLSVREAQVAAPTLIDPDRLGVSYLGSGSVLVDATQPRVDQGRDRGAFPRQGQSRRVRDCLSFAGPRASWGRRRNGRSSRDGPGGFPSSRGRPPPFGKTGLEGG